VCAIAWIIGAGQYIGGFVIGSPVPSLEFFDLAVLADHDFMDAIDTAKTAPIVTF
jgi:hypothetical protein